MRRFVAGLVLIVALFGGPAAHAQQSSPAPAAETSAPPRPWVRLVFFIPAAAVIGAGTVFVRRRMRDGA